MDLTLNLDDYVRVVHYLGETIRGRYDGKDYEFPDGHDGAYKDCHKVVAHHIFGFLNADKMPAILRLGWLNRMEAETALKMLEQVTFHEVPPFAPSLVDFKRSRADRISDESAARVGPTPAPMGQGGSGLPEPALPKDPFGKAQTAKQAGKHSAG